MEHYKTLQLNKLGQRQSQTPFSSAFWVQQDFRSKKVLIRKILGPVVIWPRVG